LKGKGITIGQDVGDSVLYQSRPGLQASNSFVSHLPKMVTIRPSEWPLRNALNGISKPCRVYGMNPDNRVQLTLSECFDLNSSV
jgi:hypothetical protein